MSDFSYYFIDHIGVFENILSQEECDSIINFFERQSKLACTWTRQQSELQIPKTKKDDETFFHEYTKPEEYIIRSYPHLDGLLQKLGQCWETYTAEYDVIRDSNPTSISICPSIKIQKTKVGGGYHVWHYEQGTASTARFAVYTIYLNDVEEGGETEFLYQHLRVPAKRGSICIFPAGYTHTHRGNPPLSGEKYIVTGWFNLIK